MIFVHIPSAIDAEMLAGAVAEMREHFAPHDAGAAERPDAPGDKKKEAPVHGHAQPLRSLIAYLLPHLRPEGSRRPEFVPGMAVLDLLAAVTQTFAAQLPAEFTAQARVRDEGGEPEAFTTITVNRNWAVPLHRDSGTRPGSIVALVVVKEVVVRCPTRFNAEPEAGGSGLGNGGRELELESGDVVLYQGGEIEHGNPRGIDGAGARWAFIFYCG